MIITASWVCLLAPLGAAVLITLLGRLLSRRAAGYIASASVLASFVASVLVFIGLHNEAVPFRTKHSSTLWDWLTAGQLNFGLSIYIDQVAVFMMLIVSGVGFLIFVYSLGYMEGDDEERRYFAYMALFLFSMLLLVESGNLVLLLAGWGLVGLSSYLLIGFWHKRPEAIAAAKKAFVMNAVGDATMAIALFLLFQHEGTLNIPQVFNAAAVGIPVNSWLANLIAIGLLGGAVAKSAQLPLQTWLPDAMEGPTPVSALIHAATMVTAGVYLIVRCHDLFEIAPYVQDTAAGLGAATLLMAGLIALVQTDIKRVIAYSTMSQIGYMFLGVGLGAYASSMFLLMAHAFFKALLFMGAGIVIHALGGEQDIRNMGGLRKLMPKTTIAMWIGALALVGIPPFAGFFAKDGVLAAALAHGWYGAVLWIVGIFGAFLTGLYTFRMMFIVFGGEASDFVKEHFHAPKRDLVGVTMAVPVAVLAVLSVVGGWIQVEDWWDWVSDWIDPVAAPLSVANGTQEAYTSLIAVTFGAAGLATAWWYYSARRGDVPATSRVLVHKFYFDEAYDFLFYKPAVATAVGLMTYVEKPVIGGSITGISEGMRRLGTGVRSLQTGAVRSYAFALAAGMVVLAIVFVAVR